MTSSWCQSSYGCNSSARRLNADMLVYEARVQPRSTARWCHEYEGMGHENYPI